MKAVVLTDYGDCSKLDFRDVAQPEPGPRQVKIRVAGASINPIDWKIRRGDLQSILPLHLPTILGRDAAGEVVSVGSEVTEFKAGDRVMGLVEHAYAEFAVAGVEAFAKLPAELELSRAGALPLVGLTGAQLLESAIDPHVGDTILITGALGSVGRVAVFAAKKRGARVLAGVRASQRADAEKLGADGIVALDDADDVNRLPPLDGIADTVNGEVMAKLLDKLKPGGVIGTVLGEPRGAKERGLTVHSILTMPDSKRLAELGESVARGELVLHVDRRFPLNEAREAQALAEHGGVGKVLLLP